MMKFNRKSCIGIAAMLASVSVGTPALADSFLGVEFNCDSAQSDLARAFEANQAPSSAPVMQQMRHLIWMLQSAIALLDSKCRYEPDYAQERQDYANTLNSTMQTCQQVASSSGECYAQQ